MQRNRANKSNSRGRRRNKKLIKCATVNAQSLNNKKGEIEYRVERWKDENKEPSIIAVTETWVKENIQYNLDGYISYRNDRGDGYGGAILYVKRGIEQRVCQPLNTQGYNNSAWCWIVEKGGKKTLVGNIYRSTSSTDENDRLLLDKLLLANDIAGDNRLLLLGDFNLPNVDWEDRDLLRGAKKIEEQMLDVVNDCFLYQHVKENTRFRNLESSTLDLIFTKEEGDIRNIEVTTPLGDSDHGIVMADYVSEWKSRVVHKPRRMYKKGDYKKINEKLDQVNWEEEFENKSVQECWDIFKGIQEKLVEKYIPMSNPKDYNEP